MGDFPLHSTGLQHQWHLTTPDSDGLATVAGSGHDAELQRMSWELGMIMCRSSTEIDGFASTSNEC